MASELGEFAARFERRDLVHGFGKLDTLVPAFAATVHKSPGSEYPAVVVPVLAQHYATLKRNLLYTGVTSGKRLMVLVGQKKAVTVAVRNASALRAAGSSTSGWPSTGWYGTLCRFWHSYHRACH